MTIQELIMGLTGCPTKASPKSSDGLAMYNLELTEYGIYDELGSHVLSDRKNCVKVYDNLDDLVVELFDLDLFDWQVERYEIRKLDNSSCRIVTIGLFRMEA